MRHAVLTACAALILAAPSIALAQAQGAAKPAAAAAAVTGPVQVQLAAKMLDFIDYRSGLVTRMGTTALPLELVTVRPDWDAMWKQAMGEELDHDMPTIQSMVGQGLAKTFTADEMKIGLEIVADPALKMIYLAAQSGARAPNVDVAKATDDLMSTPAGASFLAKLQKIDEVMDPIQIEIMATVMPGVMKRFGEKAEAAEVRKRAAGYAPAR